MLIVALFPDCLSVRKCRLWRVNFTILIKLVLNRCFTFSMCSTFSRDVINPFFLKTKKQHVYLHLQYMISCYFCTCILCASCTAVTRNPHSFRLRQKMIEVPAASVTVAPILVLCSCFDGTAVLQRHIFIIAPVQTHKQIVFLYLKY